MIKVISETIITGFFYCSSFFYATENEIKLVFPHTTNSETVIISNYYSIGNIDFVQVLEQVIIQQICKDVN